MQVYNVYLKIQNGWSYRELRRKSQDSFPYQSPYSCQLDFVALCSAKRSKTRMQLVFLECSEKEQEEARK